MIRAYVKRLFLPVAVGLATGWLWYRLSLFVSHKIMDLVTLAACIAIAVWLEISRRQLRAQTERMDSFIAEQRKFIATVRKKIDDSPTT